LDDLNALDVARVHDCQEGVTEFLGIDKISLGTSPSTSPETNTEIFNKSRVLKCLESTWKRDLWNTGTGRY
jgi:hypothetical protein